jgi:hypothetical protein
MAYPYRVMLTEAQGADLRGRVGSGVAPARLQTRARILRKANHGEGGPGWSDMAIAGALEINPSPFLRVRRQFVREGLSATLERKRPDRVYERALDGAQEAHLIALACAETPDGADHWSLRLLADELVRLEVVATIVPGRPARHDPEYVRGGVANLLLMTEPVRGWRAVRVSSQRTRIDFAACIKELVDTHYPAAERIVLVLDQLTTHSPASLSVAYPPPTPSAWRTASRSTTRPSTALGATWPTSNSASRNGRACASDAPTGRRCARRSAPGHTGAMTKPGASIGSLRPPTPASSCAASPRRLRIDAPLGGPSGK